MKTNKKFILLVAENSIANIGHYAAFAIITIYLLTVVKFSVLTTSYMLLFISISFKFSRVIFASLLGYIHPRLIMPLSLGMCSIGYLALAFFTTPFSVFMILFIIGVGYGINNLLIKLFASIPDTNNIEQSTLVKFSIISVGINIAAAIGPLISNVLYLHLPLQSVFIFSALVYATSCVIAIFLPITIQQHMIPKKQIIKNLVLCFKNYDLLLASILSIFYWFLYAQFYSSMPIYIAKGIHYPQFLGSFFTLNALIVILFSTFMARFAINKNLSNRFLINAAFFLFVIGFYLLWARNNIIFTYIVFVIWTFAEIMMVPAISALLINNLAINLRLIALTINTACMGIGEGLGNFFGAYLSGLCLKTGNWSDLFAVLLTISIIFFFTGLFFSYKQKLFLFLQKDNL